MLAENWNGAKVLAVVGVTVWGVTCESHVTRSEVDFSGWFESDDDGSIFDITA